MINKVAENAPPSPDVLDLLRMEKNLLQLEIAEKTKRLQQINSALYSLEGNIRFNWTELALSCIEGSGMLLQTNQIFKCVTSGMTMDEKRKRNYLVAMSVALNNLCKIKELGKVVVQGKKGHFYGLSKWFEDGVLLPQYRAKLEESISDRIIEQISFSNEKRIPDPPELMENKKAPTSINLM